MKETVGTSGNVSDREAISELINVWAYHRDRGNWEQLRDSMAQEIHNLKELKQTEKNSKSNQ